jgi:hypothetical protein
MYQNMLVRECPLSHPNALKLNSLLRDVPKLGQKRGEIYQKKFFAQYSPHIGAANTGEWTANVKGRYKYTTWTENNCWEIRHI